VAPTETSSPLHHHIHPTTISCLRKYISVLTSHDGLFNHTDIFCEKSHVKLFAKSFLPAFFCLVFILGTIGNALVILVYWKYRCKKSITDRYLLHLAIADLSLLFTFPFWTKAALDGWIFKSVMCKIVNSMYKINLYSCMLFLMCISFDRYLAIVQATKAQCSKRKWLQRNRLICLGVWVTSIALCIPEIVYSESKKFSETASCKMFYPPTVSRNTKIAVLSLKITIGFLLPLLIMVICYALIIKALLQTKNSHKHKSLKIITTIITAFLFSQLPYNSILLLKTINTYSPFIRACKTSDRVDIAFQVTQSLAFLHSCLNPFLYVFVGDRFRKALWKILKNMAQRNGISREQYTLAYDSQERSSKWSTTLLGRANIRNSLSLTNVPSSLIATDSCQASMPVLAQE
uniref:C-C motif chemokine receptor 9 n=1 Tax=Sphenodon punctatus TaxID=8508 RepID=A0A8D0G6D8_SPHPU